MEFCTRMHPREFIVHDLVCESVENKWNNNTGILMNFALLRFIVCYLVNLRFHILLFPHSVHFKCRFVIVCHLVLMFYLALSQNRFNIISNKVYSIKNSWFEI